MGIIGSLIVGAIAGWLAGVLMKGRGFGLFGNIIVGILGGFVGGFLLPKLGLQLGGWIGHIINGTIGAVVLLFVISLIKRSD